MNVEISDNLLEKYREVIKRRMLSDDVSKFMEILIEVELRKFGEEGYAQDGLTGCKNRFQVARNFKEALWKNGWNDTSVFRNKYLCVDIDKFKKYIDIHGLMIGDNLLKDLAKQLAQNYPGKNIYRYGGDEFIVELNDAIFQPIQLPDVEIKYSLIDVVINRDNHNGYNFERAFDMYLEMGILESSSKVTFINFRYPPQNAG
ncbi:MAG: diguanylate cyclase [Anaerolineales bacterium]|nr:diguanylate cyclase [Anaerolineales bacterium]